MTRTPDRQPTTPRGVRLALQCRACGCRHLPVVYLRPFPNYTMRVRQCRNCGRRLLTREAPV
jgi:ribosomal protein S27E